MSDIPMIEIDPQDNDTPPQLQAIDGNLLPATPLNVLAKEIREINRANGWDIPCEEDWDHEHRIPTLLCLVHSEVSEALEAFRKEDDDNLCEELADIVIRCLDMSIGLGIDLDREVKRKLDRNRQRGYKHGGKRV